MYHLSLLLILFLHSHSTMYLLKHEELQNAILFPWFTFHHVSIKTTTFCVHYCHRIRFTFHHVSIKTIFWLLFIISTLSFTFHHVSIKTGACFINKKMQAYSHSTMYLLKPVSPVTMSYFFWHSHSTMYLLKLQFCFMQVHRFYDSHSTMYLLKL